MLINQQHPRLVSGIVDFGRWLQCACSSEAASAYALVTKEALLFILHLDMRSTSSSSDSDEYKVLLIRVEDRGSKSR